MSSRRDARRPVGLTRPEIAPWVVAALAALAGAACKPSTTTPAPADAAAAAPRIAQLAPASVAAASPEAIVMAEPVIELPRLESFQLTGPGKGARAPLRYHLAPGTGSFLAQTTLSSRHLEGGVFGAPVAMPAIRDGFAITTAADQPGRLALRALRGEAAAASADADAYLATWRRLLQDRRITVTVDDRGRFTAIRFNDDPTGGRSEPAKHELVQRLLSTIVPLPDEPVGVGASWRAVTILKQGPAYAKQTASYTLTARGPTAWKLHVRLQRVAEEQRLADPSLPAGTTADLLAMFRALEGDVEVDPARPMITGGTLTIESRFHVKLTEAGRPASQAIEQIFEDTGTIVFSHQP